MFKLNLNQTLTLPKIGKDPIHLMGLDLWPNIIKYNRLDQLPIGLNPIT